MTAVPTYDDRGARIRAVTASTIGSTLVWYDFILYGSAAALVFPTLFFPQRSGPGPLVAALGTFVVGFLARPIGAVIFGHFGDRIGRKNTLVATLLLMGISTVVIGLIPSYQTIGALAPVLLVLLRIFQGVGVGGEWGGSVLLAMEWGDRSRRGLFASWPQLGLPLGMLLSAGVFGLTGTVTGQGFLTWGWRVPFLLSAALVAVGLYTRLRVRETPVFERVRAEQSASRRGVLRAFATWPGEIFASMFVRLSEQVPFTLFTTFVIGYARHLGLRSGQVLGFTMTAVAMTLVVMPVSGYLSDRFGRRLVYGIGIAGTAVMAFPYFALLDTKSSGLALVAIVLGLVFYGIQYGSQAALIAEVFTPDVRYSGAGIGYQLGATIGAAPVPLLATAVLSSTGSTLGISMYILGCAVISMTALVLMPSGARVAARLGEPGHQAGFGQQIPGYGQPVPGYGQHPLGYGQQAPGYGQQIPGPGQQPPSYGQQGPGLEQQASGLGHQPWHDPAGWQQPYPPGWGTGQGATARRPGAVLAGVIMTYIGAGLVAVSGLVLLIASASSGVGRVFAGASSIGGSAGMAVFAALMVLAFSGVLIMLAVFTQQGRNGARVTLTAIGGLMMLVVLFEMIGGGPPLSVISMLWIAVAIALLWLGNANVWFAYMAQRRSALYR